VFEAPLSIKGRYAVTQDNIVGSIFQFLRKVRVATPKKKTTNQAVATICQEALRGAAVTMATMRSTVKIDDLLAFHQRLTGRRATPEDIADLEKKIGQKASPH
jgi:hypothetical protein